jgi:hypothetical protein
MKNLKIISFSLFVLACNAMMSMDDIEQSSTQEPIEKHIDVYFDEPIIDTKAKMEYTHTRYTVEPSPYAREEASEQNLAREEKLKKFRQQEKTATKIQTELRSRQAHEKLKKIRETEAAKIRQAEADEKNQAELRLKADSLFPDVIWNKLRLTVKIDELADQSYPKFKELICTSDYLTKTDWIYQFIEAAENKTIFERNSDGTINPEKFTPEFEKEIENPSDWLHEKIIKYLPEFHDLVYEAFIDKAIEQIVRHDSSWTDAVSIPAPKGHGSFQEEGTPLFPKIYKLFDSSDNELILGIIFIRILTRDPKKFELLHFDTSLLDKIVHSGPDNSFYLIDGITRLSRRFYEYLKQSGLELSPKAAENLLFFENYLKSTGDSKFQKQQEKLIQDHINWASSARQTFYLGQLLFDKNLTAFDNLGGKEWLSKQPRDMQEYIAKYIEKIKKEISLWNTRLDNAFKGGMRSMRSKKK